MILMNEQAESIWTSVLDKLKRKISRPSFETWLSSTAIQTVEDNIIFVQVHNEFSRDWLEARYKSLIFEAIREVAGRTYDIEFVTKENPYRNEYSSRTQLGSSEYEELKSIIMKQAEKIEGLDKKMKRMEKKRGKVELTVSDSLPPGMNEEEFRLLEDQIEFEEFFSKRLEDDKEKIQGSPYSLEELREIYRQEYDYLNSLPLLNLKMEPQELEYDTVKAYLPEKWEMPSKGKLLYDDIQLQNVLKLLMFNFGVKQSLNIIPKSLIEQYLKGNEKGN